MTKELVIDVRRSDISIALLEDKRLVEYQSEERTASFACGNIYLAKVKKVMPGLNAAFVDVGADKVAFVHYQDLGTQYYTYEKYLRQVLSDRKRLYPFDKATFQQELATEGSIGTVLAKDRDVLVQVVKEAINTKGPRVTCEISFAGRYLVLVPFADKVSVSGKIKSSEERARLRQLVSSIKPKNCGIIVRTVAEGKRVAELDSDLKALYHRWELALVKVQQAATRPVCVYEEVSRSVALIRDLFNPEFESIYVNNREVQQEIKSYISLIAPEKEKIVTLYTGRLPIFDNFNVTRQIKSSFGRTVNYKHGAYLIIERTEAMFVIDVNSGIRTNADNGQEQNALEVNLGAADEIARQLRLRDIGGIIVVDFIDMNLSEDRQLLYERMCKNMQSDRAKHNILPLSKFGLMQITRQRVRPAMDVVVEEQCPTCQGKGKVKPTMLFTENIEQQIAQLVANGVKTFTLHVHPYVAAYINQGFLSIKRQWQMRYGLGIKILASQKMAFLQYEFYDKNNELLDLPTDNTD